MKGITYALLKQKSSHSLCIIYVEFCVFFHSEVNGTELSNCSKFTQCVKGLDTVDNAFGQYDKMARWSQRANPKVWCE